MLKRTTFSISFWVLVLLGSWLLTFRATHLNKNELSWDVFGYYLPLEATFIHDDPFMNDRAWVEKLNAEHHVSDTLYQISTTPTNEPMYFFLLGMSYMYSIFFFLAHWLAGLLGYPQNGLSEPYQYTMAMGMVVYTIIGLIYLRKILRHFFSENLTAFLLIICVLGTNYAHHLTIKNLETVNVLFMFMCIIIWNTIRWYEAQKTKNMLAIGASITLMALIKPSEVLVVSLPLLWGMTSFKTRAKLLWEKRKQIAITLLICFLIASPQIYYWHHKTGAFFYDSYKNPGVGLDFLNPHFYGGILSYRKGWLLYTPVMLFALLGFIVLFKRKRALFFGLLIPFLISFYIIISWTEYWYGAAFSNRPMITQYPILMIPLGFFLLWLWEQKNVIRYAVASIITFFVFLNQFQWWQFRNYIIDPTRMTKAYYWRVFLKTSASEDDRKLLLIQRSYDPNSLHAFNNKADYRAKSIKTSELRKIKSDGLLSDEFIHTTQIPYEDLTQKDHIFARFQFQYHLENPEHKEIFMAVMMSRNNGDYQPFYFKFDGKDSLWNKFDTLYLTPEIRSTKDRLKFFIWNPNKLNFEMKDLKLEVLEPRN